MGFFAGITTLLLLILAGSACKAQRSQLEDDHTAYLDAILGNARAGHKHLVNADYMGCGIPQALFANPSAVPSGVKGYFAPVLDGGAATPDLEGADRDASQGTLPFFVNGFALADGTKVAGMNCLGCHGEKIAGKVVLGLGNVTRDTAIDFPKEDGVDSQLKTEGERAAWRHWKKAMTLVAPVTRTEVVGVHSAHGLSDGVIAYLDPSTLARRHEALLPLPAFSPPVDVPPWWRLKHRRTVFYNAAFKGDYRRYLMLASAPCLDGLTQAQAIEKSLADMDAFMTASEPPQYPYRIDSKMAERGKAVFEAQCASCHGQYGETGVEYAERVVPVAEVGTDAELWKARAQDGARFANWINQSWFGEFGQYQAANGYVAPPLNGIWATAPFFHNGSVPTLEGVLDSRKRPKIWRRPRQLKDYHEAAGGWRVETGASALRTHTRWTYDTTERGQSASGHTYGDRLSAGERRDLIEYLKTL